MLLKYPLVFATALFVATPVTSSYAATTLSGAQLKKLIVGKTVRFQRGSRATYKTDGTYRFRGNGRNNRGNWRISGNKVCITFTNVDFIRCDQYVKDGDNYSLRDANGNQFPVRSIK